MARKKTRRHKKTTTRKTSRKHRTTRRRKVGIKGLEKRAVKLVEAAYKKGKKAAK